MIKFGSMLLDENKKNLQIRDKFSTVAFKFKDDSIRGVPPPLVEDGSKVHLLATKKTV